MGLSTRSPPFACDFRHCFRCRRWPGVSFQPLKRNGSPLSRAPRLAIVIIPYCNVFNRCRHCAISTACASSYFAVEPERFAHATPRLPDKRRHTGQNHNVSKFPLYARSSTPRSKFASSFFPSNDDSARLYRREN